MIPTTAPSASEGTGGTDFELSQLHGRQRHRREHRADQPEADDDLRFAPAFALEVMVDRRDEENPPAFAVSFPGVFEVANLQHHTDRFHHEDAASEEEHQLMADDNRDVADQTTQRQRAGIAHE